MPLGGQPSSCSASFSKAVLVRPRVLLRPVDNIERRWAATAWPVSRVSFGWAWLALVLVILVVPVRVSSRVASHTLIHYTLA
ncbi:hypothetical protein V8C42DRAFT_305638 [Trichoderma barbatum]